MNESTVYELAMNKLGFARLETGEQFADLYEEVVGGFDHFNEQMDKWNVWINELYDVLAADREPMSWLAEKLAADEDVRSVTCLLEQFGYDWTRVRGWLSGHRDAAMNDILPEMSDWFALQELVRECNHRVSYRYLRRWLKERSGLEAPTGHTLVRLIGVFGAIVVKDDGTPVQFKRGRKDVG